MPGFDFHLLTKTLNFFESQEPEYLSGLPHSCPSWHRHPACEHSTGTAWEGCVTSAKKLLRKKKNESWAMRPRPNKSDSQESRKNLLCEIAQYVLFCSVYSAPHLPCARKTR